MNNRRPFQFSLTGLFSLTLFAAFSFWLASISRWKPQTLVGCYLLVGFVQIMLSVWMWRNLAPLCGWRVQRRQAFEAALIGCLFSLPLWLFLMIEMIAWKFAAPNDSISASPFWNLIWYGVFLTCGVFHFPAILLNVASCLDSFRPLQDRPLTVLRLLNFSNTACVCVILVV